MFPPTRWTLVEDVRRGGEPARRALDELCRIYWYPVYAYARWCGAGPADAEDLTQGFFARLLERDDLGRVEEDRGKLRSFLLRALRNYSASDHRRSTAQKRGGGTVAVSIDVDEAEDRFREEPADHDDPSRLFERRWALSLIEEAFARLRREYDEKGNGELFEALSPFLAGRERGSDRYAEVGERLAMSPGAVQVAVHRMRKRYRGHLEAAVAETVARAEDAPEELRYLLRVLGT
jgi:RNA polymerase sigma-70 factor (ECF subfamily)